MSLRHTFVVLDTSDFSKVASKGAVGFVEDIDTDETFLVRFSGNRLLNLVHGQFRPATPAEIQAHDGDPDALDYNECSDMQLYGLRTTFERIKPGMFVDDFISACMIRNGGKLVCGEASILAMIERIRKDHEGA